MFEWIIQNIATIIISLAVLSIELLAIRYLRKSRKKSRCFGCGNFKCNRDSSNNLKYLARL